MSIPVLLTSGSFPNRHRLGENPVVPEPTIWNQHIQDDDNDNGDGI